MTMLHLLPTRTAAAAENMALDFLLLQRYPESVPRFRHYEWRGPAFTFGFSQKIAFVRSTLPANESFDLCRRPTGGGVVDHRTDWTYALVLPRGHPLYDERAPQSYRIVHECLTKALCTLGQPATIKTACEAMERVAPNGISDEACCKNDVPSTGPGICFQRAELYDVVNSRTGVKIAGAAQKRNKHGLLFQGSMEKSHVENINWAEFQNLFAAGLAQVLNADALETPWPDLNEEEVSGLIEQYSDPQWNEYR